MNLKKIISHKPLMIISVLISGFIYLAYEGSILGTGSDITLKTQNTATNKHLNTNSRDQLILSNSAWMGNPEYLEFIREMVTTLKEKHAHEIDLISVQASLQDLRRYIIERYPQDGVVIFEYIITQAFESQAENILALINNLNIYEKWYGENLLSLNDMDVLERDGTLWGKRYEMFSELADELWEKEVNQKEYKQKVVQQTLKLLSKSHDMAMSERLFVLQSTIEEHFSDTPQALLINKGLLANMYFRLESVQQDLENMPAIDRQQALAQSRRQLGYTESNIADLAKQDEVKELRWKNGYQYMDERDQLASNFQGEELQNRLSDLRTEYFSQQAATIEAEEKSGFMRYERPRVYGSN